MASGSTDAARDGRLTPSSSASWWLALPRALPDWKRHCQVLNEYDSRKNVPSFLLYPTIAHIETLRKQRLFTTEPLDPSDLRIAAAPLPGAGKDGLPGDYPRIGQVATALQERSQDVAIALQCGPEHVAAALQWPSHERFPVPLTAPNHFTNVQRYCGCLARQRDLVQIYEQRNQLPG